MPRSDTEAEEEEKDVDEEGGGGGGDLMGIIFVRIGMALTGIEV